MADVTVGSVRKKLLYVVRMGGVNRRETLADISEQIDPTYTHVVAGGFACGGARLHKDLFGYDATTGRGDFHKIDASGNIIRVASHTDFARWNTHVVVGNFASSGYDDLMLYEPASGFVLTYQVNSGGSKQLAGVGVTRKTWTHLVSGRFGSPSWTDLFCYDAAAGLGEFYTTDGTGALQLAAQYDNLRKGCSQVVVGDYDASRGCDDILFYDPTEGVAEFYLVDKLGKMSLTKSYSGWRKTWSLIAASQAFAQWGGLLLYDAAAKEIELMSNAASATPKSWANRAGTLPSTWTQVVVGRLDIGSSSVDGAFYAGRNAVKDAVAADDGTGRRDIYSFDGQQLNLVSSVSGIAKWTSFVPGTFGGPVPGQDLLCYDAETGNAETWAIGADGAATVLSVFIGSFPAGCAQVAGGKFSNSGNTTLAFYEPATGTIRLYGVVGSRALRLRNVSGWSTTWQALLSGNTALDSWHDLMGLDPAADQATILTTDGHGALTVVKEEQGLAPWTHVIAAQFAGGGFIDQFFYDAPSGSTLLRISRGAAGDVHMTPRREGMRTTWSLLAPVMLDAPNNGHGMLFYEASSGRIEIHKPNVYGQLSLESRREGAPTDWRQITALDTPGGGTLLVCYKPPS